MAMMDTLNPNYLISNEYFDYFTPIITAGLTGAFHRSYKGLLSAAPVRGREAAANCTFFPPAAKAAIYHWAFQPVNP